MASPLLAATVADHPEAALVAAVAGRRIPTHGEIAAAVKYLHRVHPDWSLRRLAGHLQLGLTTVRRVLAAEEVRAAVPEVRVLSDSSLAVIASAPRECWEDLASAAAAQGWSREEIARAIPSGINDPDALRCGCGLPLEYLGRKVVGNAPIYTHAAAFAAEIEHPCALPWPRQKVPA